MERVHRKVEIRAYVTKKGKAMYQVALYLSGSIPADEEVF